MSTYSRMLGRELPCNLMDLLSIRPLPLPASVHERLRQEAGSGHDYPDVLYRLGLSHLGRQELGLARQRLQESVAAGPKFLKARLALAVVCDLLAEHASAAREIEAVLAEPESADTGADRYHLLCAAAFSFERLGEWEVASERYTQALESDPSDLFARYRLAAIDLSHDRLAEAIEQHKAILEQQPQEQAVRISLAHLLQAAGQHKEAVWQYEKALCLEPDAWELQAELADELARLGDTDEAIAHLQDLISKQGQFPDLHLKLASLYSQRGNDESATAEYKRALEIHPNYLDAHIALAKHELGMGRPETALAHFQQAIAINNQNVEAYAGLAVAQHRLGQTQEATDTITNAAGAATTSDVLMVRLGMLELQAEAAESANAAFDPDQPVTDVEHRDDQRQWIEQQVGRYGEILDEHPAWTDLRVRRGMLLKLLGRCPEAIDDFVQAAADNPGYTEAWVQLGLARQALGDGPGAIKAFEMAVQIRTDWADLHYQLGLAYCNQEQFDLAVEQLELASAANRNNTDFKRELQQAVDSLQMGGLDEQPVISNRIIPLSQAAR